MKKMHIIGKNPESIEKLKIELKDNGFDYVEETLDLVRDIFLLNCSGEFR